MRLHRFYISPADIELDKTIWVKSPELRNQWLKVFRYRVGDEVILFDGEAVERLYKIMQIEPDVMRVELVTEFERKLPSRHIYLFWSLLKKDKNDWVIQKCTELGVRNFVPLIAERSEKMGFNVERATKIAIEAAEQCGRSDIPHLREPVSLQEALAEYKNKVNLLICEASFESRDASAEADRGSQLETRDSLPTGVLIGPEGGWTDAELALFKSQNLNGLPLGNLVLRAETAAIVACTKLLQ